MELGTKEKTILHYGKKIAEYCNNRNTCNDCPLSDMYDDDCLFYGLPHTWPEVDLHE